jgi:hypothetical protein
MKKLLLALTLALAAVPAAAAGGWATVSLGSTPPPGLAPNEEWPVELTVLQHGQAPLAGVTPIVTVRDGDGRSVGRFRASPTGRTGVYRAVVRFPGEGTYSYEVFDGFTQYGQARTHTFAPVAIGPEGSSFPIDGVAIAVLLALAGAAGVLARRRSGRAPKPAEVTYLKEAA